MVFSNQPCGAMAIYRSGPRDPENPKNSLEERRQWLADLHKGLDEAKAKAEADWDPSMMKNEPLPREQPSPTPKKGPRGGRYTDGITKDGRRYRRYF